MTPGGYSCSGAAHAGRSLAVVSKRLGHSSVSITSDTYSHLLEGVGREAAERAAALVRRNRREQSVRAPDRATPPDRCGLRGRLLLHLL